jgi:hypothetical protein
MALLRRAERSETVAQRHRDTVAQSQVLMRPLRRPALTSILALLASVLALGPVLISVWSSLSGSRLPAWSHLWCSSATLRSVSHAVGGGGLSATLHTTIQALAVHWPHFLPILLGLATLVYLWRADARYDSNSSA